MVGAAMTTAEDRTPPPRPDDPAVGLHIRTLEDAERWIKILHRRSVQDAETHNRLRDRIRALEGGPLWRLRRAIAKKRER